MCRQKWCCLLYTPPSLAHTFHLPWDSDVPLISHCEQKVTGPLCCASEVIAEARYCARNAIGHGCPTAFTTTQNYLDLNPGSVENLHHIKRMVVLHS